MLTGHLALTNHITCLWFRDIGNNATVEWKCYFVDNARRNDEAGGGGEAFFAADSIKVIVKQEICYTPRSLSDLGNRSEGNSF
jgi:hypothetical protein